MAEPILHRASTAILSLATLTVVGVSLAVVPGLPGLLGALLALLMLSIAATDCRQFIIPDALSAPALAIALLHAAATAPDAIVEAIALSALRASISALVFLAIAKSYVLVRHQAGLGLGDIKLIAVAGAWLDWYTLIIAIDIAVLSALTFYLVGSRVRGQGISGIDKLPLGLFIAPTIWLGWLTERWLGY